MNIQNLIFNAKEGLNFYLSAQTVHDIDSPFVFELLMNTIEIKEVDQNIQKIENLKNELINSKEKFKRYDLGKGSMNIKPYNEICIGKWVENSSINKYYGRTLYRLVKYLKPEQILELGTAAGISTSYLAIGFDQTQLATLEGDPYLSRLASENFRKLSLANIKIFEGDFDETLTKTLSVLKKLNIVFVDGNHDGKVLLNQINSIWPFLSGLKIIIIDDIRWSKDMFTAWQALLNNNRWNIKLDLFRMGLLICNADIKHDVYKKILPSRWKRWRLGLLR